LRKGEGKGGKEYSKGRKVVGKQGRNAPKKKKDQYNLVPFGIKKKRSERAHGGSAEKRGRRDV